MNLKFLYKYYSIRLTKSGHQFSKMKTKSKVAKDLKNQILEKSRVYTRTSEPDDAVEEEDSEASKVAAAEKQAKRERMRRKKELKKQAKLKNLKKDDAEAKKEGLSYLHLFSSDKDAWSFRKKQQMWLLKNVFNSDNISDEDFQILLEYLVELKGAAKSRLMEECEQVIKKQEDPEDETSCAASTEFERARSILQILV